MRKPVLPRMLGLLVLFCGIFVLLVCLQFAQKGGRSPDSDKTTVSKLSVKKPEKKPVNPADYIIVQAKSPQSYNELLEKWKKQSFSYWGRIVPNANTPPDEDSVSAYCSEAAKRGIYRTAVSSVSSAFLNGRQRSHQSSVYLGGMGSALRSFTVSEQEKTNQISQMISGKQPEIFAQSHVLEFLLARGYLNLAEEWLEQIRVMNSALDAASITYKICPGIFEGYTDFKQWRANADNPFDKLADRACLVFAGSIRKDTEKNLVFIFNENISDTAYNIRLGKAVSAWADATGKENWAILGRSLILSALSLADNNGAVPAFIQVAETGKFLPMQDSLLSAAIIYKTISPSEYYPRAAGIGSSVNSMWAWTAASSVSAVQENNVLNISIAFPTSEIHFLMIRGIRPFTKLQIYNMDYPSDSEFERYESSGWVYSRQEQILILKLKHREPVEHVKVYF